MDDMYQHLDWKTRYHDRTMSMTLDCRRTPEHTRARSHHKNPSSPYIGGRKNSQYLSPSFASHDVFSYDLGPKPEQLSTYK